MIIGHLKIYNCTHKEQKYIRSRIKYRCYNLCAYVVQNTRQMRKLIKAHL